MRKALSWTVGYSGSPEQRPDTMVTASVPGNANLDWAAANGLPDWRFGVNFERYRWMEDCWWLYETRIPPVELNAGETLYFVTEGIDYEYIIMLDGQTLHRHEGMFTSAEIRLDAAKGGLLQIWIAPPPKDSAAEKNTRAEAAQSCKPAVSYGWDWHPRLIPAGMWCDAYLETRPAARFNQLCVDYILAEDYSSARLTFKADITGTGEALLTVYCPDGRPVLQISGGGSADLANPTLWWCNGYGEPNLYRWEAVLLSDGEETDRASGVIGFRRIELTMNEGAWDEPPGYPVSRSPAPATVTLNGVPVFAKGSNWVNPEVFTGTITRDTYAPLIELAKKANFNLLRCWGGAIINKQPFFDLCNEHGIMVWQEFPLACNNYYGTPRYLAVLEREARAVITRLKSHPCLVLWCGGNELFNSWSKMTEQSAALRLLDKLCYELDPERPFIMTSPLNGMAHGGYFFRYKDGREVFQVMPNAHYTAYPEFGVPSVSNIACCDMAADRADIFPMEMNEVTAAHHAFNALEGEEYSWAYTDAVRDYFGEARTLEQLIGWSQWLQGEGYKCIYEEARRQKPYCSMALNWCYNEAWPTLANNSIINYPADPKASFYDVADACRGALMSARIPKFVWRGGEVFSVGLWLLNDGNMPAAAGLAEASVELDGRIYPMGDWNYGETPANINAEGPVIELRLPCLKEEGTREMKLIINAGALSSRYRLLYRA